jgi:hypothetical protein
VSARITVLNTAIDGMIVSTLSSAGESTQKREKRAGNGFQVLELVMFYSDS